MSVLKYKDASGTFHRVPLSATEEWGNVLNKPFSTIDTNTLKVTNGELSAIGGGSDVTVTQTLTEGTEIGSIAVDGTETKLYAPAQGTDFTLEVVDALPEEGENGVFYLTPASKEEDNNSYNEYVWIESTSKFELVGSTEIDLSEYLKEDDITVTQTLTEGVEIGSVTIGETETKLYAPEGETKEVGNVARKETLLWSGTSAVGTITLADNLSNYSELIIEHNYNNNGRTQYVIINISDGWLTYTSAYNVNHGNGSVSYYVEFHFSEDGTSIIIDGQSTEIITKIIGVSYEDTIDSMYVNLDQYSEEEQVIGSWTNGKPIYRRVFAGTTPSSTGAWISFKNISDLNVDSVITLKGIVYSSNMISPIPYGFDSSNNIIINCSTDFSSINLYLSNAGWKSESTYVTFEYTKSTDAENSFSADDITSKIKVAGIGYDNYSTDEIVVGKWIDGKPVYRTILSQQISSKGRFTISIGSYNIEKLLKINGFSSEPTGGYNCVVNGYSALAASDRMTMFQNSANTELYFDVYNSGFYGNWYIIIDYTKTTDAENSFKPSMVASSITEFDSEIITDDDIIAAASEDKI